MPSPFPGMNPFLEREGVWRDFHGSFLPMAREMLNAQIVPRYFARIDEDLYVREPDPDFWRPVGRSDVQITQSSERERGSLSVQTVTAPAEVRVPILEVERSAFLEIRDRDQEKLITVIELLSPSNKRAGKDRERYEAKRSLALSSATNLVEIDLLRGGRRLPLAEAPPCEYYALVCRSEEWPRAGFWPIRLRDRLPVIPIPLGGGDNPVPFDLQEALHRIYDTARYGMFIYKRQPEPPLSPSDAEWAQQFLPQPAESPGPRKRPRRKRS
jgi:hypothetical protein